MYKIIIEEFGWEAFLGVVIIGILGSGFLMGRFIKTDITIDEVCGKYERYQDYLKCRKEMDKELGTFGF